MLERAAATIARRTAERLDAPSDWWMGKLIKRAVEPTHSPMSRSGLGILLSEDSASPGATRVAVQPPRSCSAADLHSMLTQAGRAGLDTSAALQALGTGCGFDRGGWEIALGDDRDAVRAYAAPFSRNPLHECVEWLRERGWWPGHLGENAVDRLERLRTRVLLRGVGRRMGHAAGFKIYARCVTPLQDAFVTYFCWDSPKGVLEAVRELIHRHGAVGFAPSRHGWTLTVDRDGELVDWKLELFFMTETPSEELPWGHPAAQFLKWAQDVASDAGVVVLPAGVSIRVRGYEVSEVPYLRFVG